MNTPSNEAVNAMLYRLWPIPLRFTETEIEQLAAELTGMIADEMKKSDSALVGGRTDTERLDWIEENASYKGGGSGGTYSFFSPADVECGMLREAIDQAMSHD